MIWSLGQKGYLQCSKTSTYVIEEEDARSFLCRRGHMSGRAGNKGSSWECHFDDGVGQRKKEEAVARGICSYSEGLGTGMGQLGSLHSIRPRSARQQRSGDMSEHGLLTHVAATKLSYQY